MANRATVPAPSTSGCREGRSRLPTRLTPSTASTLELPMGSGPYKMTAFAAGSSVTYTRDPNYWAAGEPQNIGENNFDTIRYEYFRDPDVAFEGFKGDQFDWWDENRAKRWA